MFGFKTKLEKRIDILEKIVVQNPGSGIFDIIFDHSLQAELKQAKKRLDENDLKIMLILRHLGLKFERPKDCRLVKAEKEK